MTSPSIDTYEPIKSYRKTVRGYPALCVCVSWEGEGDNQILPGFCLDKLSYVKTFHRVCICVCGTGLDF